MILPVEFLKSFDTAAWNEHSSNDGSVGKGTCHTSDIWVQSLESMVEGENGLQKVVRWLPYVHHEACTSPYGHTVCTQQ